MSRDIVELNFRSREDQPPQSSQPEEHCACPCRCCECESNCRPALAKVDMCFSSALGRRRGGGRRSSREELMCRFRPATSPQSSQHRRASPDAATVAIACTWPSLANPKKTFPGRTARRWQVGLARPRSMIFSSYSVCRGAFCSSCGSRCSENA